MPSRADLEPRLASAKSVADIRAIAEEAAKDDPEFAKEAYQKAARHCADSTQTVAYARGWKEVFGDGTQAQKLLDDAAAESQFTKDLVAIAIGYKEVAADDAKAAELMQQAEEYCMTGEEQVYLAEGKVRVLGDAAGAKEAYEQALKETGNLDPLLELGRAAMGVLKDGSFAKKIYDKAESKVSRAPEYVKLAAAAVNDLMDKDYAAGIFNKAAEKLSSVADLLSLASEAGKTLGDPTRAKALYQRALDSAADFPAVAKLLDAAKAAGDNTFLQAALNKGGELASNTPDFIDLAKGLLGLGDRQGADTLITRAENAVNSLDDLQKLAEGVKAHFSEQADRVARILAKLEKRIANQARYVEFQKQEEQADTVKKLLALADRVMVELEDPFYAAKLLDKAEALMRQGGYQFSRFEVLIRAIDKHLDDSPWITRLLDEGIAQGRDFITFKEVVHCAANLQRNRALGQEKARAYLQAREAQLKADSGSGVYDFTKLAQLVLANLRDTAWGGALLDAARQRAQDHYALAHIGYIKAQSGDAAGAAELYRQAATACKNADTCLQLAIRLKQYGLDAASLKEYYAACGKGLSNPADKLCWVEGMVDELKNPAWASETYAALASQMTGADQARFEQSRMNRVGNEFYPYRKHAA